MEDKLEELYELIKNEPDSVRFTDDDTGFECFIRRHPSLGILCGYVSIPESLVEKTKELSRHLEDVIDVHGGITFSDHIEFNEEVGAFKRAETGDYAIGFDCGHWDDFVPSPPKVRKLVNHLIGYEILEGQTYKDIDFVKNECKKLAKQLHEVLNKDNGKD